MKAGGIYRSFTNGDLIQTGEAFDLAIEGNGFFKISMPDGSFAYTRVAAFQKNAQGLLTTLSGYTLVPNITIPPNARQLKVNEDGQVMVEIDGQTEYQIIGQIDLTTFINPSGLKGIGDSLFAETHASGAPETGAPGTGQRGRIKQGYREGSNVNSIEEITDIITLQRMFENLTKVLNAGDSMMDASNKIGRG